MRSKWMRYSSSSASRSPCWPRSTSRRMWSRSGASGCAVAWLSFAPAITGWMPGSRDPEPHARLAPETAQVDDSAEVHDVTRVFGVERDGSLLADPALELVGRLRGDEHAERLPAVEADLDPHLVSHGTPPPRVRRGRNPGGRTQPRARTGLGAARHRRARRPHASATRARRGCPRPRTRRGACRGTA